MRTGLLIFLAVGGCTDQDPPDDVIAPVTGTGETVVLGGGAVVTTGAFFQALGTNGRSCATCHDPSAAWTVTPSGLAARFASTGGMDPVFATNDGADSPSADRAIEASHHQLLTRGTFRVGLPVPANADFTLDTIDDPYGHASASDVSLFRRPRPSTNLTFVVQLMWDGREPTLAHQATDATTGHAQAATADPATMDAIVSFESKLITAQSEDAAAGTLPGPSALAMQPFSPGVNDAFGNSFNRNAFTLFAAWDGSSDARKAAIARGERIFNTEQMRLDNVPGLPGNIRGTCTTCHDTPNVGNHSSPLLVNIGVSDASRRKADQPLYTLRSQSGATIRLTDPGAALVSGKFADAGKFVVPVLRGLEMRAPYFHDGSAATLAAVVDFYDNTFDMNLRGDEKDDLVAFLEAL